MVHILALQVLPLAHTSGSNRDEVQLVNPQGVNLKAYEARLETAISDYTRYNDCDKNKRKELGTKFR